MTTQLNKPEVVQMFDRYVDREYYKVYPGFFSTYNKKVRTDRLENETELRISCNELPDKVYVNGEPYKLIKDNE